MIMYFSHSGKVIKSYDNHHREAVWKRYAKNVNLPDTQIIR